MVVALCHLFFFFFFNDTATTEIYTLSLQRRSSDLPVRARTRGSGAHAALRRAARVRRPHPAARCPRLGPIPPARRDPGRCRSEEHTSELQSQSNLVCRLLLEKKKNTDEHHTTTQRT